MSDGVGETGTSERAGGVSLVAPAGRNRSFVWLGFGFAAPWLAVFLIGSIAVVVIAGPDQLRIALLGALWVNLLVGIIHILAVALVWLGAYARWGEERISLDAQRFEILRTALGIRVPFRLKREPGDGVRVLGAGEHGPGKGPHARLEWHAGGSALRFGAGLSPDQAEATARALHDFMTGEADSL